jgi:UDP-N-acetylglucosamine 2-epimerase (non-hydrolysing)
LLIYRRKQLGIEVRPDLKISIVLGTRPEIIKLSPIIHELERLHYSFFILHTGQHYSYCMDRLFFNQLRLPEARYDLEVGSGGHGEQTGKMLVGIERILRREEPDIVLVEGDTNTVLAGALSAAKLSIMVGHVEAGLRSYDTRMPEEINRVLTDHCSDLLFAPTEKSRQILIAEGIPGDKIFVTGNTVVDAVYQNLRISESTKEVFKELGLRSGNYFAATLHRQENVDDRNRLRDILDGLELIHNEFGLDIVCPIHPRTKMRMKTFGIVTNGIRFIQPLDYLSFLQLEKNAKLILTDSGGVQEEACILRVPCVTLRDNTERPETLEVGSNVLAGSRPQMIVDKARIMLSANREWINPFGDGNAASRIIEILSQKL